MAEYVGCYIREAAEGMQRFLRVFHERKKFGLEYPKEYPSTVKLTASSVTHDLAEAYSRGFMDGVASEKKENRKRMR